MAELRISELTEDASPDPTARYFAVDSTAEGSNKVLLETIIGTNVRTVNSMADFPAPAAGVITLEANTVYKVLNTLSTSDRFAVGSSSAIIGESAGSASLSYSGVGNMFTGADKTFSVKNITLDAPTGTIFDMSATVAFLFLFVESVTITSCSKLGNLDQVNLILSLSSSLAHDDGFSFTGTGIEILEVGSFNSFDADAASKTFDLGTATFDNIRFEKISFNGTGTGISGAAASANVVSGDMAFVSDNNFTGITTPLSGITREDIRWDFQDCPGVRQSFHAAEATLIVSTTVTIASTGVFVAVNGSNWVDKLSESFTISTAGVITYIGEIDRTFKITAFSTMEKTTGGVNQIAQRIAVNGTTIADSEAQTENATATSLACQTIETLSLNDTVNTWVANNDSTGNVDVLISNVCITEV